MGDWCTCRLLLWLSFAKKNAHYLQIDKHTKYDIFKPRVLFMYLRVSETVCAELRVCS